MNRVSRAGATVLCAGSLALAGLVTGITGVAHAGSAVHATAGAPASVPAATSTSLVLLGTPLTIAVESGPGGALSSITLTPTTVPTTDPGLTATKVSPDAVRFVNDAGTVRVDVSSRHGGQNISARAGQLSDVAGPGTWSGDVFGDGSVTKVDFVIGDAAGAPDISGVVVNGASNVIGAVEHRTEENGQQASVSIRFTSGLQTRTLTIRVQIGTHDGDSVAKVSISLSRTKGLSVPSTDVVGTLQTWTGQLCDGSPATITYMVDASGAMTDVTPTPAADVQQQSGKGVSVSFSDHERVRIRVKTSGDGATMKVSVDEKFRCDAADPTLNVPVATTTPDDANDQGDDNGGDHSGDHSGDHGGHHGSHDGNEDETSTTVAGSSSAPTTTDDSTGDHTGDHTGDGGDHEGDGGSGSGSGHDGSHHG